jgi:DNA-binding GntR family transcriptional regulator
MRSPVPEPELPDAVEERRETERSGDRYRLPEAPLDDGPVSLVDAATKAIRDRILDLSLAPGRLINIRWLLEHLGLSRTPIREALNRLATEGLIEFAANQGVYVRPLDFPEIDQLMEAFRVCERISAFHCRFDHPGLSEDVRQMQEEQRLALGERRYLDATWWNFRFRLRIAETSANNHLIEFYRRTANHTRRLSILIYRLEARDPEFYQAQLRMLEGLHRDILDALEAADRERLMAVLTAQVDVFRGRIAQVIQGRGEAPFPVA